MGVVTNVRTVKGSGGIGTIKIKYGKIKPKSRKGFYLFLFGLSLLLFRFMWSRPTLRVTTLTPVLREVYLRADYMRWAILSKFSQGDRDIFNRRYTISEATLTDVAGLRGEWAHISRDVSSGSVTLSAKSAVDAVFAQGYVHAAERLYQLDISRRKAKGTVAEVLGDNFLPMDKLSRTLNIHELAKQDWQRLTDAADAETAASKASKASSKSSSSSSSADNDDISSLSDESNRRQVALLTAYAAGINAYLSEQPVMPAEFYVYLGAMRDFFHGWGKAPSMVQWTPVDSLAILRMYCYESSHGWEREYLKTVLTEALGSESVDLLLLNARETYPSSSSSSSSSDAEEETVWLPTIGGVAWVVPGKHTASGASLLASDSHSPTDTYTTFYQNEIKWSQFGSDHSSGSVVGSSLPGVPLVMHGRNDHIAWGMAVADEDTEDLFAEDLWIENHHHQKSEGEGEGDNDGEEEEEGATTTMYLMGAGGKKEEVRQRTERIFYHGRVEMESVELTVMETRHGPIINNIVHPGFFGAIKKHNAIPPPSSSTNGDDDDDDASSSSGSGGKDGSLRFEKLALSSQALRQPVDLSFAVHMSVAAGWVDFQRACEALPAASFHVIYADQRGHTGYATTGRVIPRRHGHDSSLPVWGDGLSDWKKESPAERKKKPSKHFTHGKKIAAVPADLAGSETALHELLFATASTNTDHDDHNGGGGGGGGNVRRKVDVGDIQRVLDDVRSPSSIRLSAIIANHKPPVVPSGDLTPGEKESGLSSIRLLSIREQLKKEGDRIRSLQSLVNGPHNSSSNSENSGDSGSGALFDGQYRAESSVPVLLEVFRQNLAERVLASLPGGTNVAGLMRGAPLALGFTRDPRSVALLPGSTWLLRLLEEDGNIINSDSDNTGGGSVKTWLSINGLSSEKVVREAISDVTEWVETATKVEIGDSVAKEASIGEKLKWKHHHTTAHAHYAKRHTIQSAVMSPAPLPANGGADDCMYKMPYTIPTLAFKSIAHGDIQYSKKGMKGALKMPFMAAGTATYTSSVRLISDMSSSSSPSSTLAWSAGSATVYHGQIQPSAAFTGGVSFASEVIAYLVSCLSSVFNHNSLIQRQSKSDAHTHSAGPGPWHVLGGGKEAAAASPSSVVRLLKAAERRVHDEL
jgi:acyl-homoserine lactone acylase PvdQ